MNIGREKSRGYYKIEGAARAFNFDFKDKVVLDIGSSTGGFTQYALEQGAKKIIAIEKGTGQMKEPLRSNSRVELYEKTDIFSVRSSISPTEDHARPTGRERASAAHNRPPLGTQTTRRVDGPARSASEVGLILLDSPDIILADVSFISLTKILKYAKMNLSRSDTDYLVMLKPQFEAEPKDLKDGVIKNDSLRRQVIKKFELWLRTNGFIIVKKHDNNLKGRHGNTERFYYLRLAK